MVVTHADVSSLLWDSLRQVNVGSFTASSTAGNMRWQKLAGSSSYRAMGQYADEGYKRMLRQPSAERQASLRARREKRQLRGQQKRLALKALDAERKAAARVAMAELEAKQEATRAQNMDGKSDRLTALAQLRLKRAAACERSQTQETASGG